MNKTISRALLVTGLVLLILVTGCKAPAPEGDLPLSYPAPDSGTQSTLPTASTAGLPAYLAPAEMLPLVPPKDADIPDPSSGLASVGGIPVYIDVARTLSPNMVAYLTPATGQGNDVIYPVQSGPTENDYQTVTDSHGWVIFKDVAPGNYFLVVVRPPGWTVAVKSEQQQGINLLLELKPDQKLNLGIIYLP